jgi:hypothetical protein
VGAGALVRIGKGGGGFFGTGAVSIAVATGAAFISAIGGALLGCGGVVGVCAGKPVSSRGGAFGIAAGVVGVPGLSQAGRSASCNSEGVDAGVAYGVAEGARLGIAFSSGGGAMGVYMGCPGDMAGGGPIGVDMALKKVFVGSLIAGPMSPGAGVPRWLGSVGVDGCVPVCTCTPWR